MPLFTYGTLMIPDILESVTGKVFRSQPALLPDFARYTMQNETYPALVPEIGSDTSGIVYFDVDPLSMERVDAFEGVEYLCKTVKLVLEGGRCLEAQTYVLDPAYRARLSTHPWDMDEFRQNHMPQFMRALDDVKSF